MKLQYKNNIIHRAWVWISLLVNDLIMWVFIYSVKSQTVQLLIGAASAIAISVYGILKMWYDIGVGDFSRASVVIDYMCVAFISSIFVYITYVETYIMGALSIFIAMIIETIVAIIIFFRYRIKNKLFHKNQNTNNL